MILANDVSAVVRNKAEELGAGAWLDALPDLLAELEAAWGLTVGRTFSDGTEAHVVAVRLADGADAVLKLLVPRPGSEARDEIEVLRLVAGDGCARLLRHDVALGALLIERLGPSLHEEGLPLRRRHEILCATAARVWRPAPDAGFRTGAEKGRWLIDDIQRRWEELGRPCREAAVDHALRSAARRIAAHDDERAVLVHGDVHEWNALRAPDGYLLVDPDGLHAEAEYDLGVMMREDPVELLEGDPVERARWLADRTGLDPVAIWEWGVVERVSTGLICTAVDLQPFGRQMLATADAVVGLSPG